MQNTLRLYRHTQHHTSPTGNHDEERVLWAKEIAYRREKFLIDYNTHS